MNAAPDKTSLWRTRLGHALVAWTLLCLLLILGIGPIGELLGEFPVS